MQFLMNLVIAVQILSALAIIALVLLQQGKGADMGASFGSGASGTLFGATGSANALSRATAVAAATFFICTLALAGFATARLGVGSTDGLLEGKPATAVTTPASGAAAIPGAMGAQPTASSASAP